MTDLPDYSRTVLDGIRAAEQEGRMSAPSAQTLGDIFPYESPLLVRHFDSPTWPEPIRSGEQKPCWTCDSSDENYLWTGPAWRIRATAEPLGVLTLFLELRRHADLSDLTDGEATNLGRLTVRLERAMRAAVDGIERVHVNRWGDGSAHLHLWFIGRPAGLLQLRGSSLPDWLEVLPPLPVPFWQQSLAAFAAELGAAH